jgi:xylulokinase
MFPLRHFRDDAVLAHGRICCYAHVVPDRFVVQGGMAMGGGSLGWIGGRLFGEAVDPVASALEAAAAVRPGARGLLYYPYLGGNGAPVGDENVAASFIGIRPEHDRGHLVRAVLEGVAFGVRHILDATGAIVGRATPPIRVVGGGSRSSLWLRIRASIIGEPIQAVDVPEAVAVGAALLAGTGAGVFPSAEVAAEAVRRTTTLYEPDPADQRRYEPLYRDGYLALYPALRSAFATLSAFARDSDK